MENPRPEKVAVVDRGAGALRASRRRPADRVPRARTSPALADLRRQLRAGRRRVQGLQEHPGPLRRPRGRRRGARGAAQPAPRPSPSSHGDAAGGRPRPCATTPGPTPPWWSRAGCSGTKVLDRRPTSPPWPTCRPARSLLARLAGAFQAPLVKFAGLLQALPRNFAYGLKALIDQRAVPAGDAAAPRPTPPREADDHAGRPRPSPTSAPANEPPPEAAPDEPREAA